MSIVSINELYGNRYTARTRENFLSITVGKWNKQHREAVGCIDICLTWFTNSNYIYVGFRLDNYGALFQKYNSSMLMPKLTNL